MPVDLLAGQPRDLLAPNPPRDLLAGTDPTATMSPFELAAAGAGKAVYDTGRGLGQIARMAMPDAWANALGLPTQADIDESKRLDAPLMRTGAGQAGNITGNIAITALPAAGVSRLAQFLGFARTAAAANALVNPLTWTGAALGGATLGAIQPTGTGDNRLFNTAAGAVAGLAGQGIVKGLGAIAQPTTAVADAAHQKAVDTLSAAGVPLDLAQTTGSPFWSRVRSSLTDNPFTLSAQRDLQAQQQQAFAKRALELAGGDGTAATPDVMGAALDKVNGVFRDVLNRNNVALNPQATTALADIQAKALEQDKAPVARIIDRFLGAADPQTGVMPGQIAYGIKKDLDPLTRSNDSTLAYWARQAQQAVMDTINGSLSGADQAAFATARGQRANLFNLEKVVANDMTGTISPARLANVTSTGRNRTAAVYGNGPQDMIELAQAGKQLLPDHLPNSGTGARMMAQFIPSLLAGGIGGIATGDPWKAGEYAASVLAMPKAAQFLINNPTAIRYMTEGITGGPVATGVRGLLEAPASNSFAGLLTRRAVAAPLQLELSQ